MKTPIAENIAYVHAIESSKVAHINLKTTYTSKEKSLTKTRQVSLLKDH
jgi:hypothetical protein